VLYLIVKPPLTERSLLIDYFSVLYFRMFIYILSLWIPAFAGMTKQGYSFSAIAFAISIVVLLPPMS